MAGKLLALAAIWLGSFVAGAQTTQLPERPATSANTIRSGIGKPSPVLGIDGDFYIDLTLPNMVMYGPKKSNVWPASGISLIGPAGAAGPPGIGSGTGATVAIGTTSTGATGTNAIVTNSGSSSQAIFNFTIPRGATGVTGPAGAAGAKGATGNTGLPGATGSTGATGATGAGGAAGVSPTISIGTVSALDPGDTPTVTNVGSSTSVVLDIGLPAGAKGDTGDTGPQGPAGADGSGGGGGATVAIGTTTTGAAGSSAIVTNTGTTSAAIFNFTIPRGATGAAGSTGATGATGSSGAAGAKGDTGAVGSAGPSGTITIGTVTTGLPGSSATVVNTGSSTAAVLNFTIPQGATGATGSGGGGGTGGPTVDVLANIPATCNTGDLFFASDQGYGQQLYTCAATNVWVQQNNLGGSGGLFYDGGSLDINTAVVPRLAAANTFTGPADFTLGLSLLTANTHPSCDTAHRGTAWYVNNGSSKDNLQLCVYNGSAFVWTGLY